MTYLFGDHVLDLEEMTVFYEDEDGEKHDLNYKGEDIETYPELREFVLELYENGAFQKVDKEGMVRRINYVAKEQQIHSTSGSDESWRFDPDDLPF